MKVEGRGPHEDANARDEERAGEGAPVGVPGLVRVLGPRGRVVLAQAGEEEEECHGEDEEGEQLQSEANKEDLLAGMSGKGMRSAWVDD